MYMQKQATCKWTERHIFNYMELCWYLQRRCEMSSDNCIQIMEPGENYTYLWTFIAECTQNQMVMTMSSQNPTRWQVEQFWTLTVFNLQKGHGIYGTSNLCHVWARENLATYDHVRTLPVWSRENYSNLHVCALFRFICFKFGLCPIWMWATNWVLNCVICVKALH